MRISRPLKAIVVVVGILFVAACSSASGLQGSPPVFIGAEIPSALRRCLAEPAKLTGDFTQKDVAVYISQLRFARSNCAANLSAVDNLLIQQETLALLAMAERG